MSLVVLPLEVLRLLSVGVEHLVAKPLLLLPLLALEVLQGLVLVDHGSWVPSLHLEPRRRPDLMVRLEGAVYRPRLLGQFVRLCLQLLNVVDVLAVEGTIVTRNDLATIFNFGLEHETLDLAGRCRGGDLLIVVLGPWGLTVLRPLLDVAPLGQVTFHGEVAKAPQEPVGVGSSEVDARVQLLAGLARRAFIHRHVGRSLPVQLGLDVDEFVDLDGCAVGKTTLVPTDQLGSTLVTVVLKLLPQVMVVRARPNGVVVLTQQFEEPRQAASKSS